jgi:hypothetical protein
VSIVDLGERGRTRPTGRTGLPDPERRLSPTLSARYAWYCERQVSMLLALLPQDTRRSLYRAARDWAAARSEHEAKDPMATLRRYCRHVLPLPPFAVWEKDFQANRGAYLEDDLEPPGARTGSDPVTVAVRSVVYRDRPWRVELRLFSDGDVWRGFMAFRSGSGPAFSTADVFCESTPRAIRHRFQDFASETLCAFLRSALP